MYDALAALAFALVLLCIIWSAVGLRFLFKGFGNESQPYIRKILHTMAGTIDDLKNVITQEETVEQGLITLVNGLGTQIKAALPGLSAADQATVDGLLTSVANDSAAMSTAITTNTPNAGS